MKFCTKCGQQLADETAFCPACGCRATEPTAAPAPQPVIQQPVQPTFVQQPVMQQPVQPTFVQQPVMQQPAAYAPAAAPQKKPMSKGKLSKIFGILSVLLLPLLGIPAIIFANGSKIENGGVLDKDAKHGLYCGIIGLCFWGTSLLIILVNGRL